MKLNTRKRQLDQIEKFRNQFKVIHTPRYPKIFIENSDSGYTVWGYTDKDSEMEEVVTVLDCADMDFWFFKDNVLGPVAYYLGADDEEIAEFVYFGGIRTRGSHNGGKEGGKYI